MKLEIKVVAGLCTIVFNTGSSTGPKGSDSSPGVGFEFISDVPGFAHEGKFHFGNGVIGRRDALALRNLLETFLKNYENNVDG